MDSVEQDGRERERFWVSLFAGKDTYLWRGYFVTLRTVQAPSVSLWAVNAVNSRRPPHCKWDECLPRGLAMVGYTACLKREDVAAEGLIESNLLWYMENTIAYYDR